jgi:hypothetical protein
MLLEIQRGARPETRALNRIQSSRDLSDVVHGAQMSRRADSGQNLASAVIGLPHSFLVGRRKNRRFRELRKRRARENVAMMGEED